MARKKATKNKVETRGSVDILGILYISFSVLLFGALVSYDGGDLSFIRQPPNEETQNWMGPFGAYAAYASFFVFGGAAFILPVLLLGFGLAHYLPILRFLSQSYQGRFAALGVVLSCMGILDLYSDKLIWLQSAISSKGAGGYIGHLVNQGLVSVFNKAGALTLYVTIYLISLVAFTNFDIRGFLRELWERYQDRRDRMDAEATVQERELRREERRLAKQEEKLRKKIKPSVPVEEPQIEPEPEVEKEPEPEPLVVDHSVTSSKRKQKSPKPEPEAKPKAPKKDEPVEIPVATDEVQLGETIPAEEVASTTTADVLGRDPSGPAPDLDPATGKPAPSEPTITLPPDPSKQRKSKKKKGMAVAIPPVIGDYALPSIGELENPDPNIVSTDSRDSLMANAKLMQNTLSQFGIEVSLGDITKGPTITRYELLPAPGIKLERIANLSNNIAAALKAERINILAPVPGKGTVGVEIPNKIKTKVIIRDLLESDEWEKTKARLPLVLGKDVYGKPMVVDLAEMPHLLIAGSTGSGKSVCINAIIASLLYRYSPEDLRFVMIDPKVVELQQYNTLPHLVVPVVTDPKKVVLALRWVVNEMEKRYQIFAKVGVRNVKAFNDRPKEPPPEKEQTEFNLDGGGEEGEGEGFAVEVDEEITVPRDEEFEIPEKLSYIVVVIDELADLMLVAPADVEMAIARITQMARAAGIHCIVATQRPSVDVITGVIKANIPARIAFQVASKIDSRTILDSMGADKLLGKGDMLYLPPGSAKLIRAQGVLITDEEIQRIVDHIAKQGTPAYEMEIHEQLSKPAPVTSDGDSDEDEELIEKCIEIIRREQKASVSLMQRRLRIGYTRAARIMDEIEDRGIVGPSRGAEPREILIDLDGTGADGKGQGLS